MKAILYGSFLVTTLMLTGCEPSSRGYKYNEGTFPETPLNLGVINSPDDDYNSTVPTYGEVLPLIFSSKRGGRTDFDFVKESFNYRFDRTTGTFSVDNRPYGGLDILQEQAPLAGALSAANSAGNELGPYVRSYDRELIRDGFLTHYAEYLMLFASDRSGHLDIYLTHNYQTPPASNTATVNCNTNKPFKAPVAIPGLNSSADDAYPTFNKTFDEIYFTSNRGGTFDIYKAKLPAIPPTELHSRLPELTDLAIEKVTALSGTADDKCPYIDKDILVFTSNRPGGLGGFDLYYSRFEKGSWSEPVNFGPSVNSAYDEYRPVLRETEGYRQRLLLFSSNRPGGKGGFDLYLVGVLK